jgi:hypothetical protein
LCLTPFPDTFSHRHGLSALALMTIPALMVFLSVGLRPAASRWANIVVAGLYIVVSLGNLAGESWTYLYFGAAIEVALLVTIIWYAWNWPRRLTD